MLKKRGTLSRKRATQQVENKEDVIDNGVSGGDRLARSAGSGGGSGNGGEHGILSGESVSPVPRPLSYKHVTFSLVQSSIGLKDTQNYKEMKGLII